MSIQSGFKQIITDTAGSPAYLPLLLFSFSLPFAGIFNSLLIVLILLMFIVGVVMKKYTLNRVLTSQLYPPLVLYLLWIIGCFYSNRIEESLSELQLKSTILLFPFLFFFMNGKYNYRKVLLAFVAGCLVAILICLFRAVYLYATTHVVDSFLYADLSFFMHPGYFSMYLVFSSLIIIFWNNEIAGDGEWKFNSYIISFLLLLHYLMIALLSSRTNYIALIILLFVILYYLLFRKRQVRKVIMMFAGLIIFIGILFIMLNSSQVHRIKRIGNILTEKEINISTTESVDVRLLIWRCSFRIIRNNFWTGVGTADVKEALLKEYSVEHISGAEEKELNAHNEYLQTWIGLGTPGLLALLLLIFLTMYNSIKERNHLLTFFLILVAINFLTESMLQRQAGVVFFAFFPFLLAFCKEEKTYLS